MDDQEAGREGPEADREGAAGEGYGRGAEGEGKVVGEDDEGTVGDAETGYVGYAGVDSGVEAEGPWKGVEEVAQWQGEVERVHHSTGACMYIRVQFFNMEFEVKIRVYEQKEMFILIKGYMSRLEASPMQHLMAVGKIYKAEKQTGRRTMQMLNIASNSTRCQLPLLSGPSYMTISSSACMFWNPFSLAYANAP